MNTDAESADAAARPWNLRLDQNPDTIKEKHLAVLLGLAGDLGNLAGKLGTPPTSAVIVLSWPGGKVVSGTLTRNK